MKRRAIFLTLFTGLVLLVGLSIGQKSGFLANAEDSPPFLYPPCDYRASILAPLNNQELSGVFMVRMSHDSSIYVPDVFVMVDNNLVGAATHEEGTPYNQRQFALDVRGMSLGTHNLRMKVRYSQSTSGSTIQTCITNEVIFKVVNTSGNGTNQSTNTIPPGSTNQNTPTNSPPTSSLESLTVVILPGSWRGPTSINRQFEAKATARYSNGISEDVSSRTAFEWEVSIGKINTFGRNVSFSSGPQPGEGELKLLATFGTKTALSSTTISVQKVDANTSYPEQSQQTDGQGQNGQPLTEREGDEELKTCLGSTINDSYQQAVTQNKRLNSTDIEKAQQCFAARRFVIPANLAPFEARKEKILLLPVDDKNLKISSAAALTNKQTKGIVFKGVAEPNKTILMYIFSEPLVLAAKTDASGNWSYTLEDPLEPGTHEAFIAVEGENADDARRSSGFGFAIASVTKTKENPLGLSLDLQNRSDPQVLYMLYAFASGVLTLAAVATVIVLVRRKQHIEHLSQPQ